MYLIAGLGNPGEKYTGTRHNVGFFALDELVKKTEPFGSRRFSKMAKLKSEILKSDISGDETILLKPTTYMNLSGEAVGSAMKYFKIEPSELIVISDDSNLDPGQVRLRFGGESGGHNGLKSIISAIGSEFWRLRIGIGQSPEIALEDFVLGKIGEADKKIIAEAVDKTTDLLIESISDNNLENKTIN